MPPADALHAEHLSKAFGPVQALRDVTLGVARGETLALLGPSGCGKSTALRCVAGLERPDAGRVRVGGRDVTGEAPEARHLGLVFQDYALFPHLSVLRNVMYGLRGLGGKARRDRAMQVLKMVGLLHVRDRRPQELSGGQQQRVAVARAIVGKPLILLADEPTGNLDSKNGGAVMDLLKELHAEGATICMVTHDPRYAHVADRAIHLFDGQVVSEDQAQKHALEQAGFDLH
jgi:ABC-type Fe3+/spermidine/putrescine transport system ATPase subunit